MKTVEIFSTLNQRFGMARLVCVVTLALLAGCSGFPTKDAFREAAELSGRGGYRAALDKYDLIMAKDPANADRALFEMGIIHARQSNQQRDHQKSLECFERLIRHYPDSTYRKDSEMMIFYLNSLVIKDAEAAKLKGRIESLQGTIETLTGETAVRDREIERLQKQIEVMEKKIFSFATHKRAVDRILIEKRNRRLTLITQGEQLKSYRIALGGNPAGPKERQGDNKTPEGLYTIDSRHKSGRYHLSLHISYPNEKDRKRARELGVPPGGDIMIHGIKNGFAWVGEGHADADWTQGCIAVTDAEIEEIARVAPNGTVVEIRP